MRTLAKVSLALASGVLLNVALAWACALAVDLSPLATAPALECGWSQTIPIDVHAETKYRLGFAQAKVLYRDRRLPMSGQIYAIETEGGFAAAIPSWTGLATPPSEMDGVDVAAVHTTVDLCGWPFLCLASTTSHSVAAAPPSAWGPRAWTREEDLGLRVPWIASRCDARGSTRCLPTHPVWTAFLVDSGLLSIPALHAFAFPALRARRRRLSGRCPHCAYPVANLDKEVCPECGKAA